MPIFQVDIEKRAVAGASTGEYWTNRYLLQTTDLDAAADHANRIVNVELDIHTPAALLTKASVRDLDPATDLFRTITINSLGTYGTSAPTDLLPAMLVVRVDFTVSSGRPSRKYYHLMLGDDNQAQGFWSAGVLADVQGNMDSLIEMGENRVPLCDPQSFAILSAAPMPIVTVHQFRRGSKRKLVPVLP